MRKSQHLLGHTHGKLAKEQGQSEDDYLREAGLERYTGSSLKGSADLDWSDEGARQALLTEIVRDARAFLEHILIAKVPREHQRGGLF